MSPSSGSPEVPIGPVQLNGWKEIAAYLGRSVRTVQRWEKDFGLPVRRFGSSKSESVFALPREIDAWLETSQGMSARSGAGAPETSGAPAGRPPEPLFPARWFLHMAVAALVTATVMTVLWAVLARWRPAQRMAPPSAASADPAPAGWHVDLDTLVVSDARGNELWKHKFPHELMAGYEGGPRTPKDVLAGIADVDGNGFREVWFVSKEAGVMDPARTAMYLFEPDGRVRWVFRPSVTVRFGADTFGPSWFVDRVFVTADPAGGPGRAIWAVLYDAALFPSSIQRLDARSGAPLSSYWSNGSIVTVALDTAGSRPRLLVGASANEYRAGSLAVLDALNPNGSAPALIGKYRCTSCPPGEPLAFLIFPKPARFGKSDASGPVEIISPMANGAIRVRVRHAASADDRFAVGIFTLDPDLAPASVDTADGYARVYSELAARGDAPAGAPAVIDSDREFLPILRWDGAARRYVKIGKAAAR